jgi:hypothetical protein
MDFSEQVQRLQFPKLTCTRGYPEIIDQLAAIFGSLAEKTGDRKLLLSRLQQLDYDAGEMVLTVLWSAEPTRAEREAIDDRVHGSMYWAVLTRHLVEPRGEFDL